METRKIIGRILAILGIVCLLVSAITSVSRSGEINRLTREAADLGELIDAGDDHANLMAKVQASGEPHVFAGRTNGGNFAYYFVVDENYNYIVYASEKTISKLSEGTAVELRGVLREFTNDIRDAAIDWLEQYHEDNPIEVANFRDYFGSVYLDTSADAMELTTGLNLAVRLSLIAGIILLALGIVFGSRFSH